MATYSPSKTDTHIYPIMGGGYSDTPAPIFGGGGTTAPKINKTQPSLYDITRTVSAEGTSVPIIYGRAQIGGRVFALDYNATSKLWTVGYVIAMGEIDSYAQVWMNGEAPAAGATFEYYTGTTGQTASPKLAAAIAGYTDTLVVTHPQGNFGIAYIVIQYSDADYQGWPDVVVEVLGKKVWNPATSLTEWSGNPALHLGDLLRSNIYGMGKTVNTAGLIAAQDYCDDTTIGEQRRRSYVVMDNPQMLDNWVSVLSLYAGCFVIHRGDEAVLLPDKDGGSSIMSIGEDDIVAGSLSITKKDSGELPTVIYASYTDTTEPIWKSRTCDPAKLPGVDAGTVPWREQRINLMGIKRHSQAVRECIERLNKLTLSDLEVSFSLFDEGIELEIGDIISLTHSYGLTAKLLRVVAEPVQEQTGQWRIMTGEYDPAFYDDSVVSAPTYPDTDVPVAVTPSAPTSVLATEVTYQLANGQWASRLEITWNAPADSAVTGYNVTVTGGGDVVYSASTTGTDATTGPLLEGVTYTASVTAFTATQSSPADTDSELIDGLTTLPNAPASLSGSNNDSTVYLYWPASATAAKYEVRYYTTAQAWGDGTTLEIVDGLSLTSRGVVPLGTWRFAVKSINHVGNESASPVTQDITVAAAPAGGTYTTTYYAATPPAANQVGDLWWDSDDNHQYRANTAGSATQGAWTSVRDSGIATSLANATQALTNAATAQSAAEAAQADATQGIADALIAKNAADAADAVADGKVDTWFSATDPGTKPEGDLWINTNNNEIKIYKSGTGWVDLDSATIASAASLAADAQDTADLKISTYYGTSPPTASAVGDIWIDTTGGANLLKRANAINPTSWTSYQDGDISVAQSTADGKNTIYYAANAPSGADTNDLWVRTSDNLLHVYNGSWTAVADADIAIAQQEAEDAAAAAAAAQADATNALTNAATALSAAQDADAKADGKVTTFYAATEPTATGIGDLWIDSDNRKLHRADAVGSANWVEIQDDGIGDAIAAASAAEALADQKIVSFYGASNPSGMTEGDLWIKPVTTSKDLTDYNSFITTLAPNYALDWDGSQSDAGTASDAPAYTGTYASIAITNDPTAQGMDQAHTGDWNSTTLDSDGDDHSVAMVVYIPPALADGEYGLYSNGGTGSGQGFYLAAASGVIEIVAGDTDSGGDLVRATISSGVRTIGVSWFDGASGFVDLWVDGARDTKTTATQIGNGTGDPVIGDHQSTAGSGDSPGTINGSGIVIGRMIEENNTASTWDTNAVFTDFHNNLMVGEIGDGVETYWYDGTGAEWILYSDAEIIAAAAEAAAATAAANTALANAATAIADAATAQGTADSKITTFTGTSTPSATSIGDLWIHGTTQKLYQADATGTGGWNLVQDDDIGTALSNAATAISDAADADAKADSKIVTFAQTSPPIAGTIGDLWIDTSGGANLIKRATNTGDPTTWAALQDGDISTAQATADGKNAIYRANGPTGPTGADEGDLWFEIDNGNKPWRYSGSEWVSVQDTSGGVLISGEENTSFTAVAGERYPVDTTTGPITMTLPAGVIDAVVFFFDSGGSFHYDALTIAPNGSEKIMSLAESMIVSLRYYSGGLVYVDATKGWQLI